VVSTKIQDEQEIIRWFREGRTYRWMSEQYLVKYNIEAVPSMFSNFRRRRGLDRRINRDDALIPWQVLPEHRWRYPLQMLRAVARDRAGFELRQVDRERLPAWLRFLETNRVVVHYDPESEEGFIYVPREPTDEDIIRLPTANRTTRRNADA
jgi:hypothetical protein